MCRGSALGLWVRGLALVFLFSLLSRSGSSHDLWMILGKYHLAEGELTRVFINSGDTFPESLSLLGEHRVTTLALHGPSGREPISRFRVDGKSLSFDLQPRTGGSHVLALATRSRRVRLKAEDFDDYLAENGLASIQELRDQLGESAAATVERYTKWAKAMLDVGESESFEGSPAWSRPVGHTVEIVPMKDPNGVAPGQALEVQVLYEGEPLSDAPLTGGLAGGSAPDVKTTTDEDGRASVTLTSAGRWYLRSIHMIRSDGDPEVVWESYWCTLTFEIQEDPT